MADLTSIERPHDSVAVLTLDRPEKRNALSIAMRDRICDDLEVLAADDDLKVVVLAGSGPVFSSGFDLGEFQRAAEDPSLGEALWASSDRYHRMVATFPLVTVAAVDGPAIAGGFDLAVLCDLRIATTATTFSHPEHAFGDVVYGPLHDLVGGALARDLCLTGRTLSAAEALEAHLVSAVVEPGQARSAALELAERVAVAPRDVLLRTKQKALRRSGLRADAATLDL